MVVMVVGNLLSRLDFSAVLVFGDKGMILIRLITINNEIIRATSSAARSGGWDISPVMNRYIVMDLRNAMSDIAMAKNVQAFFCSETKISLKERKIARHCKKTDRNKTHVTSINHPP